MKSESHNSGGNPQRNGTRPNAVSHTALADLKAYLDGELPAWRHWLVQAHLACCGTCREESAWLKRLGEDMKDLERATPSPRLRARILASLPDTPPRISNRMIRGIGSRRTALTGWPRLALACAGAMLLLFGVSFAATQFSNHSIKGGPQSGTAIAAAPSHSGSGLTPKHHDAPLPPDPNPFPNGGARLVNSSSDLKPDQFNRYADEQVYQQEAERARRAKSLWKRNGASWSKALAALQKESAKEHPAVSAPIRLSLEVPDVAATQRRLMAWAQEVGGSASDSLNPSAKESPHIAAPSATATMPRTGLYSNPVDTSGTSVVAVLKVPLHRARELQPVLKQLGVLQLSVEPASVSHATAPKEIRPPTPIIPSEGDNHGDRMPTVKVRPDSPIPSDRPTGPLPALPHSTSDPASVSHDSTPFVILHVRLKASPAS